ncbi:MAG TPA: hypothetical protein VHM20_05565 [Gammaproteobacteria bacterium]|jgi:hypothetical protein|nr:hypothetical protein [Gammaproteobacteria bacterium]
MTSIRNKYIANKFSLCSEIPDHTIIPGSLLLTKGMLQNHIIKQHEKLEFAIRHHLPYEEFENNIESALKKLNTLIAPKPPIITRLKYEDRPTPVEKPKVLIHKNKDKPLQRQYASENLMPELTEYYRTKSSPLLYSQLKDPTKKFPQQNGKNRLQRTNSSFNILENTTPTASRLKRK